MHYVFSNESKTMNSQKPEIGKNCFLNNMRTNSINKYLENYFDFGCESVILSSYASLIQMILILFNFYVKAASIT